MKAEFNFNTFVNALLVLVAIAATVMLLSGCGMAQAISKGCGGDLDTPCDMLFGQDTDAQDAQNDATDKQIEQLKAQYQQLVLLAQQQANQIAVLQSEFIALNASLAALAADEAADVSALQGLIDYILVQVTAHESALGDQQAQIQNILVAIAEFENYSGVVEIIDVCGTAPGAYNEVLLRLANGQVLASFSANGSAWFTRLVVLSNGNYSTTDGTGCNFNVNNGVVSW